MTPNLAKALAKKGNVGKWIEQAIVQHESFVAGFQKLKEHALNAGIFFLTAQQIAEHGDWEMELLAHQEKVSRTTVYRYIAFANEVLEWTKVEHPKLTSMEDLRKAAVKIVLQSPKGYIALCRQLSLMRKFGEYDEVKYKAKKLLGQGLIEFNFADLATSVEQLTHFGDTNYTFKFPEGVDEAEYISTVELKLEAALSTIRRIKKTQTVDV